MHTSPAAPAATAQRNAPHPSGTAAGLGLRLRTPLQSPAGVDWHPWQIRARRRGFHVSRESTCGTHRQFVRNEVGDVRIFRKRETAQAACDAGNGSAA